MKNFIIFVLGLTAGSVGGYLVAKRYYCKLADKEVKAYREKYEGTTDKKSSDEDETEEYNEDILPKEEEIKEFLNGMSDRAFVDYTQYSEKKKAVKETPIDPEDPFVIPPEEFDEMDFDTVNYTLYSDGVLVDAVDGHIIESPDEIIGLDALNHFGEYEEDSVYIRNPRLKLDIEILMDCRTYSDCNNR